ncbi:MAG: hypothetical protein J5800_01690 [Spirochaetales bacterium]|nr:hypothetical protein [Spirochaetales bacterium]
MNEKKCKSLQNKELTKEAPWPIIKSSDGRTNRKTVQLPEEKVKKFFKGGEHVG